MVQYMGKACEACKKVFEENEQTVYCPQCGAPLHRACWEKNGGCPYSERHSSGFKWAPPAAEVWRAEEENIVHIIEERKRREEEELDREYGEKKYNGVCEREMMSFMNVKGVESLYRLAVIKRMISEKKLVNLNFCAGLLSPYNQFFHGMLPLGLLLLAVYFVTSIPSAVVYYLALAFPETAEAAVNGYGLLDTVNVMSYLRIGIMFFVSIFGDYLYVQWMVKKIKKIRQSFQDERSEEYLSALAAAGKGKWGLVGLCFLIQMLLFFILIFVLGAVDFGAMMS